MLMDEDKENQLPPQAPSFGMYLFIFLKLKS